MVYSLADNIHHANVDGQAVFLDLVADRYFALPEPLNVAFQTLLQGSEIADADLIDGLLRAGVVVLSDETSRARATPIVIATNALPQPGVFRPTDVGHALLCQYHVMWQMRRLKLVEVLASATGVRPVHPKRRKAALRIADAFAQSNALLSVHDNCLMKSVALLRSLRRNGHPADMVIGVQARPFAAHCWVQWRDMVLNDDPDHVGTFVPILGIR